MRQKILLAAAAAVVAGYVVYRIHKARQFSIERILRARPSAEEFVFDYVGHLRDTEKFRERELKYTQEKFNIEFVVVIVPTLGGRNVLDVAATIFTSWGIGLKNGGKGVLLFFSDEEQQFKIEVGHALEPVFTDLLCGEIEKRQIERYFRHNNVGAGISATLEEFLVRFRNRFEDGGDQGLQTYFSGGAGVKKEVPVGEPLKKKVLSDKERKRYAAQPSPEKAFMVLREVFKNAIDDPNLGIYTEGSRIYLDSMTKAMPEELGHWTYLQFSKPYEILRDGDYAVVIFYDDRFVGPIFLQRTTEGWQVDVVSITKWVLTILGGEWHVVGDNHPYMFAFRGTRYDDYASDMNIHDFGPFSSVTGNFRDSIEIYRAKVVKYPYDFDAELYLARIYMDLNIVTKALDVLKNLSRKHPYRGVPYYYIGLIMSDDYMEYDEAIDCFKRFIRNNPTMSCGYHQLAETYYRKGLQESDAKSYDKAIQTYQKYARLGDERFAYNMIGFIYLVKSDTSRAIKWFRKTIEKYPDDEYAMDKMTELVK
jgi:hypothetical protein